MQDEYSFEFIPSSSCAAAPYSFFLSLFISLFFFFFFVWSKQVDGGVRKERKRDFSFFFFFLNLSSYSRPSLLLVVVSFRIGSSWWLYQTGASANVTAVNEHFFLCLSACSLHSLFCFVCPFFLCKKKTFSAWLSISLDCPGNTPSRRVSAFHGVLFIYIEIPESV